MAQKAFQKSNTYAMSTGGQVKVDAAYREAIEKVLHKMQLRAKVHLAVVKEMGSSPGSKEAQKLWALTADDFDRQYDAEYRKRYPELTPDAPPSKDHADGASGQGAADAGA